MVYTHRLQGNCDAFFEIRHIVTSCDWYLVADAFPVRSMNSRAAGETGLTVAVDVVVEYDSPVNVPA